MEVPRSGCDITKMIGIDIIDRTKIILVNELTFSIFVLEALHDEVLRG